MNATFDRRAMLSCLARFPGRRSKQTVPLRVIAVKDGVFLLSPEHRDFVPALVVQSAEFLTSLRLFATATRILGAPTLTLQADGEHFRYGELKFRMINHRVTDEVTLETLTAPTPGAEP